MQELRRERGRGCSIGQKGKPLRLVSGAGQHVRLGELGRTWETGCTRLGRGSGAGESQGKAARKRAAGCLRVNSASAPLKALRSERMKKAGF